MDTNDPCVVNITVLDPNPAVSKADLKVVLQVDGTSGISCNKNAIKVVEILEEMHIKHDLEYLEKIAPSLLTMEEKDRLMKHTNVFMSEVYSSVSKILHHFWDKFGLKIPEDKDEVIARIVGNIIGHLSHGNAAISGAILRNIKDNFIDTSGKFTWSADVYSTKDFDKFDKDNVTLADGKVLKITDATREKETAEVTDMLDKFVTGKLSKEDLEKEIVSMESEIDNSGTLPEGVIKNDPKSMALNSVVKKEEISQVETGSGVTRTLLENLAGKLFRGCMANTLLKTQTPAII